MKIDGFQLADTISKASSIEIGLHIFEESVNPLCGEEVGVVLCLEATRNMRSQITVPSLRIVEKSQK